MGTVFDPLPSCEAPGFLCSDGSTCLSPAQVCDGMADCPRHEEGEGGEDEEGCSGSGGGRPDDMVMPASTILVAGGKPDEAILASPILVALTSRPGASTERQVVEEEGSNILEEETQNVLSEVLRVVDETRRRLEETKDSKSGGEATTEAVTFNDPSGVTKEVDNLVASTTKEEEVEGTLVTGKGSNVSGGSTKPTEVWTLRPNWSTGGSTLQEEEKTTMKVLTTIDETTEVTSSPTEQVTAIGESVTTVAAKNVTPTVTETVKVDDIITKTVKADDIVTPTVTETVSLIDAASLFVESVSVTEESSTESARADLTTPVTADEDDSSVTTENAVTTEQSDVNDDKKDFPEVKLERENNEVEIDEESEKETSVGNEEEFGAEQPRAFS